MKLVFKGHNEQYVVEQSVMSLFPGELPVYETIQPGDNTWAVISMTEANQNFSKVARVVDKHGRAVIFKNNAPRYLVIDFSIADSIERASTEAVLASSNKLMGLYDDAFKELAK